MHNNLPPTHKVWWIVMGMQAMRGPHSRSTVHYPEDMQESRAIEEASAKLLAHTTTSLLASLRPVG